MSKDKETPAPALTPAERNAARKALYLAPKIDPFDAYIKHIKVLDTGKGIIATFVTTFWGQFSTFLPAGQPTTLKVESRLDELVRIHAELTLRHTSSVDTKYTSTMFDLNIKDLVIIAG